MQCEQRVKRIGEFLPFGYTTAQENVPGDGGSAIELGDRCSQLLEHIRINILLFIICNGPIIPCKGFGIRYIAVNIGQRTVYIYLKYPGDSKLVGIGTTGSSLVLGSRIGIVINDCLQIGKITGRRILADIKTRKNSGSIIMIPSQALLTLNGYIRLF